MSDLQETAVERVARGLAWLRSDEAKARGFDPDRIDLGTLAMSPTSNCPLGQSRPDDVEPCWSDVLDAAGVLDTDWDYDHGFMWDTSVGPEDLTSAWESALTPPAAA